MANKPSWQGHYKDFCRMMQGNGYTIAHRKGTHNTWRDDKGHVIVLGAETHLRDELVWNMIRKYGLKWQGYL